MYCRRRAAEGAFGRFVLGEGAYFHDIDDPGCNLREVARSRMGGRLDASKVGDPPMHYPTHSIGGLLSVMKAHMTEVSAFGYEYPGDDWHRRDTVSGNVFGNETALFRLSNGGVARICEYRRIGHRGYEGFSLFGTEGSFVEGPGGCHWVTKHGPAPLTTEQMRDPLPAEVLEAYSRRGAGAHDVYGGHGGSHAYLAHEFVQSVATGRRPAVNAWEAARYFVPGVMAHKSALRGGELLKVPDFGDPPE
jgi:predicted dehydrogenase